SGMMMRTEPKFPEAIRRQKRQIPQGSGGESSFLTGERQFKSCASQKAVEVFPTPGGPQKRREWGSRPS
ncbi:MAG: hypothetical protein NC930_08125, partial [Candidatus Omnitrophica bacterium]|nr:hypothetical protein [Candidatus Omnitrophota bacterium]